MKQKKYLIQLNNTNKENGKGKLEIYKFPLTENGKRRTCNSAGLSASWLSFGKENDAFSAGYW